MTYPRHLTAQLLDYDGSVMAGSPLAKAFGINFYDEWDGPGRGGISLPLSEAGSAELLPGRYVDCLVEGTVRFTFKIEGNPQYKLIERQEELTQVIIVSGRGWGCITDEATIDPEYNLKFVLETTWRLFSFASKAFPNDSAWVPANPYAEYLEGVDTANCYGHAQAASDGLAYPSPIGFPWTTNPFNLVNGVPTANYVDTFWIRPGASVLPGYADPGLYFFRGEFTLTETTAVTFDVTGDNFFTLFIEGVPILGEEATNGDHFIWKGWKGQRVWMPSGTFTVAAAVYNVSFADLGDGTPVVQQACPSEGWAGGARFGNPGGLMFAAYVDGGYAAEPTYLLTSDDTWDSWYHPTRWPGWTPGQIVQKLLDEAIAEGCMTVYNSNTFTAADDSNSDAWRPVWTGVDYPDIPTFGVEVGSTVMNALELLVKIGWIHWHVRPGTWILDIYRGRDPVSPTAAATLTGGVGGNLRAFEPNATAPYANALRVQWAGGYTEVVNAAAIAQQQNKVRDVYSSDAATEEEAIAQGENELLRRAQAGYPAIVAVVEPASAADCPYEAFETGDYVQTPQIGGGTQVIRCYSIQCDADEEGYAIWTLELNGKMNVPERTTDKLLQQLGGRNQVFRGSVK